MASRWLDVVMPAVAYSFAEVVFLTAERLAELKISALSSRIHGRRAEADWYLSCCASKHQRFIQPGQEIAGRKRLGQIEVSPCNQSGGNVGFPSRGCQEYHFGANEARIGSDITQDIQTCSAWHSDIQEHERGPVLLN